MNQRYKLVSSDNGATFRLYDLLGDSSEQSNIAPANPEIVARMRNELDAWIVAVAGDTEYVPPPDELTVALSTTTLTTQGDSGETPTVFSGSGTWATAGTSFNTLFGADPTWFAVASNHEASATTHTIRLDRVRLVEGTEPPPRILGILPDLTAGEATVSCESIERRRYALERSANLDQWSEIDRHTATERTLDLTDQDADSNRLRYFYRVRLLPGE